MNGQAPTLGRGQTHRAASAMDAFALQCSIDGNVTGNDACSIANFTGRQKCCMETTRQTWSAHHLNDQPTVVDPPMLLAGPRRPAGCHRSAKLHILLYLPFDRNPEAAFRRIIRWQHSS